MERGRRQAAHSPNIVSFFQRKREHPAPQLTSRMWLFEAKLLYYQHPMSLGLCLCNFFFLLWEFCMFSVVMSSSMLMYWKLSHQWIIYSSDLAILLLFFHTQTMFSLSGEEFRLSPEISTTFHHQVEREPSPLLHSTKPKGGREGSLPLPLG